MDIDEITFNPFFLVLRDKFRRKYDLAVSKCWAICVPCSDFLKDLTITDEFVDDHILKPVTKLPYHYVSTDSHGSRMYKFEDTRIRLVQRNGESVHPDLYRVKILSVERGYNSDFQMYNILIVDKVMDPKYLSARKPIGVKMKLNRSVTCYKEAFDFLHEISSQGRLSLVDLKSEVENLDLNDFHSAEDLRNVLQEWIRRHWARTMRLFTLDIQRDARFQKLLSTSLEIFIMHYLHDRIYQLLTNALDEDDQRIKRKIDQLIDVGVTPDQLGVKEALSISLPSAIVEMATLDARQGPLEKLSCLKTTLDLIVAEIKGALADVETRIESHEENDLIGARRSIKVIPTDDLIPLLIYVIVKSRPRRLITDLHYIQNFLWSVSPYDGLSYAMVTFKAAICTLQDINVSRLPRRSSKVRNELPINEVLDVVTKTESDVTPIDRQVRELAVMLEECTKSESKGRLDGNVE
ncbi:ankyrin repeat domain-containing protein 27 isoform X1 [Diachasma alloeum]|uniref:ankyrin repeat domain-containing protein 27 isoform X1 n=2 Tax=Diachasma alloeum TaxID=454923 RepID=UPI000738105A|nr:ankyrin repeat domain-containing protein 27 isoform X1 [Diachasma alloeum]